MKTNLLTTVLAVGMLSSCSSSFFLTSNTSGEDDIYYNPEKKYVASVSGGDINPLNSTDARIAELQRKMNATMSDTVATSDTVYVEEANTNPYESVLVSSIEESRERRLKAQSDLSFSYNDYSDALFYASAYDPAFYNVVIYGSHVWVEPRWVSSSWYFPRSSFSLGFGYEYGAYWPGVSYGYGIYNPWGIGLYSGHYWGYNDYYDFHGYYYGRPANSNNYYFGRRGVNYSEYNRNVDGVDLYDNNRYAGTRRRGTSSETRTTNNTTTSNPYGDLDGRTLRRRPDSNPSEPKNMNQPNGRQRHGTTMVYTRPSTVNQKGGDGYTPTYTKPAGGVRQDYNSSRPASNGNSGSYDRRPATSSGSSNQSSGSSGNSYSRPTSSNSGSSYSRPTSTSSGSSSSSNGNSNSGSSGGTRRR